MTVIKCSEHFLSIFNLVTPVTHCREVARVCTSPRSLLLADVRIQIYHMARFSLVTMPAAMTCQTARQDMMQIFSVRLVLLSQGPNKGAQTRILTQFLSCFSMFINFHRNHTIVQRCSLNLREFEPQYNDFHGFSIKHHDSTTNVIDFEKKNMKV